MVRNVIIGGNIYPGAAQELAHDVLDKLDVSNEADLVRGPAMTDELNALTTLPEYNLNQGESG